MRPFSDAPKNAFSRLASDAAEPVGDESLISDTRSQVRPTELVERKLQVALQCSRLNLSTTEPAVSH
jgi:hypothetical protein